MKASGSPPIYCFPLLYCLNFIAQFDKLSPRILKNSTSQDQTERKNDRFETSRLRDPSKTLPRFRDRSKLFWDLRLSKYHSIPLYFQHYLRCYGRKTGKFGLGLSRRVHKDPRLTDNPSRQRRNNRNNNKNLYFLDSPFSLKYTYPQVASSILDWSSVAYSVTQV